jgi:transcription initiation factor TFIID subunit 3
MDNPFYFSLARISAAQILRAAGIDRTRPSTLDCLTDILIRYLHLLATQSMLFSLAAGRPEADIRDIRLAMQDVGIIAKSRLVSKKRVRRIARERDDEMDDDKDEVDTDPDGEDEDDESTETLKRLLNWFKGPQAAECRRVAGASSAGLNGVTGLPGEQVQRPSFVAEYVTSIDSFGMFVDFRFDTERIGESKWR